MRLEDYWDGFMEDLVGQSTELFFFKQLNDMFSLIFSKSHISLWVVHRLEKRREVRKPDTESLSNFPKVTQVMSKQQMKDCTEAFLLPSTT